jgi:hypothetical protein
MRIPGVVGLRQERLAQRRVGRFVGKQAHGPHEVMDSRSVERADREGQEAEPRRRARKVEGDA